MPLKTPPTVLAGKESRALGPWGMKILKKPFVMHPRSLQHLSMSICMCMHNSSCKNSPNCSNWISQNTHSIWLTLQQNEKKTWNQISAVYFCLNIKVFYTTAFDGLYTLFDAQKSIYLVVFTWTSTFTQNKVWKYKYIWIKQHLTFLNSWWTDQQSFLESLQKDNAAVWWIVSSERD